MSQLGDLYTRLQVINKAVTGINTAEKYPPLSIASAKLPLMFSRLDRADFRYGGGVGASITEWYFELVVLVSPIGLNTVEGAMGELEDLAEAVRDEYAGRMHLNNDAGTALANISVALLQDVRRQPPEIIGDTAYSTLRFTLYVKDMTPVTTGG